MERKMRLTPNENSTKALFLDRDGTLVVDKGNCGKPSWIELIPGAREGLILALEAGYRLFLFTNQGGIGRGLFTVEALEACQQRMFELLGIPEGLFTEICMATESPEDPETPKSWRKPSPRFILESIENFGLDPAQCFMIGDREADWLAGLRAGIQSVAIRTGAPISEEWERWLTENHIPIFRQFYSFARTLSGNVESPPKSRRPIIR